MISLSTAFNIHKCGSWQKLLSAVKELGFKNIELNVEVPSGWIKEIESSVKNSEINVSSLHNYCPKIESLPKGRSIHYAYSLAALDEKERSTAVRLTLKTVETAERLGAKAVVIHSGEVPTSPSGRDVFMYALQFGRNARLLDKYKESIIKERKEKAKEHLESLKKSLNQVLEASKDTKVSLGLETRIYYNEIPLIEELAVLFKEFKGAPLFYWHDTGHAEVNAMIGFVKEHEDFLKAFKDRLLGIHLHDLKELDDHYAPGSGDFDFRRLLPYLNNATYKVIEAHSKASDREVKDSLKYFKKIGLI